MGLPGGSAVKNLPTMKEARVLPLGQEDPLEKEKQPTPVFLPGKSHDRGAWRGTVHGVAMESDTTERLNKLKQHLALLSEGFFMVTGIPHVYIIDLIFLLSKCLVQCNWQSEEFRGRVGQSAPPCYLQGF